MTQLWTITSLDGANVLCDRFETAGAGVHPKDAGWAWDAATQKVWPISTAPQPSLQRWTGSSWGDDTAKIEARLIADIKAEAERRKMLVMSPGAAKKTEYADKAGEVRQMKTLGGTVTAALAAVAILSAARQASLFPYAAADAAAFGDTVVDAFNRFMSGMTSSATVPTIAAAEAKVCAAIKAATTASAKRTAAASVAWP